MPNSSIESYSPRILSTLIIGDRRINVRELSSDSVSVEIDHGVAACDAKIETFIGDDRSVIDVRLPEGVDPARDAQPMRILVGL